MSVCVCKHTKDTLMNTQTHACTPTLTHAIRMHSCTQMQVHILYCLCACISMLRSTVTVLTVKYTAHTPPLPSEMKECKLPHASFKLILQLERPMILDAVPPLPFSAFLMVWLGVCLWVFTFVSICSISVSQHHVPMRAFTTNDKAWPT